jgi:hypothetical protein
MTLLFPGNAGIPPQSYFFFDMHRLSKAPSHLWPGDQVLRVAWNFHLMVLKDEMQGKK